MPWKNPDLKPHNLPASQLKKGDEIPKQRFCDHCGGENYKIFVAKRPRNRKLGVLSVCVHCGRKKWILDRFKAVVKPVLVKSKTVR